jgi:hypothetical protein
MVCFDGKKRQQLQRGDSVTIRMSAHPLPTINKRDQTDDWVASLTECLNWNDRIDQLGVAPPSAQVTANSSSSIRTESWHRQIPLVDK